MLLKHLYRVRLEESKFWAMFIGLPVNSMQTLDVRADQLASYIYGLRESSRLADVPQPDIDAFFGWLRDERFEYPTEGWATKYLNDCGGNHLQAISKFWGFLHEYLLARKPEWFLRLNAEPLPSQIRNFSGVAHSSDIRLPEHIRAVA